MSININKYVVSALFIALGVLAVVFWSLNKGLVFADEAFYLFHLDSGVNTIDFSKWHLFARLLFNKNEIVLNRMLIFLLLIVSNVVLAKSLRGYFKIESYLLVLSVLLIGQFSTITPICYSASYLTFNQIGFNFLIALVFLYWNTASSIYLFFIGILLAFVVLNMPTALAVVLPFLFINYLINGKDYKKNFQQVAFVGLGSLIASGIYFLMLELFVDFFKNLNDALAFLKSDPKHNSYGLLKWHAKLFIYFSPVIIQFSFLHLNYKKITSNIIYRSILFLWCVLSLYYAVTNGNYNFTLTPVYLILIHMIYNIQSGYKMYLYFLLSVPYFASLGSDVNFMYRSAYYAGFVFFVGLIIYLKSNLKYRSVLIAVFLLLITNFFTYPFRKNWGGYKVVNQNTIYNKGGYHLLLDAKRAERLNNIYSLLENRNVILSHQSLYGYALLTNAKVKYLNFRYSDYALSRNIQSSLSPVLISLNRKKDVVNSINTRVKNILYTDEEITIYQLF